MGRKETPEEELSRIRAEARKRAAGKRKRDRDDGLPDGRLLDGAVSAGVTFSLQEQGPLLPGAQFDCPEGYISVKAIRLAGLGWLLGHGKERRASRKALKQHMDGRSTDKLRGHIAWSGQGEKDLFVERRDARLKRAEAAKKGHGTLLDGQDPVALIDALGLFDQ